MKSNPVQKGKTRVVANEAGILIDAEVEGVLKQFQLAVAEATNDLPNKNERDAVRGALHDAFNEHGNAVFETRYGKDVTHA